MVDSVNIDTGEMNTFLLTHVDDKRQPLSSDIDIWFQETLKHILVTYISVSFSCQHAMAKASKQFNQGIKQVSQPESILTGKEQRI